ncbi:hypothetical protein BJ684DRAFT_18920 [Piptocephalis cylindrospora]|uniref:Nuclear segregation protein Bfr1 n=1 Tax=Piptocephalis cylindrospora TaxID=1907219 RepID=A0A4P9Y9I7_9FUNG|nr:hypothetical protein BJ684DRAFT_18920 [Piptocephalis cylindrospora]|eukprot:RKP14690.1 hypothetical protein BJ684DRAFT_18920 [Piptocephalis cylindrospora]
MSNPPAQPVKRPQRPDPEVHHRALELADATIERLRKELSQLGSGQVTSSTSADADRTALRNQIRELEAQIRAKGGVVTQSLPTVLRDLETSKTSGKTTPSGTGSVEDCDKRIHDLEKQVNTEKLSLLQERKAVAEISALKRTRRSLIESPASKDTPIQGKDMSVDEMNSAIREAQKSLDQLAKSREEETARRSDARDRKSKAQKDLDEAYEAKRALVRDHRQATEAFLKFQAEERKRREVLAKERRAEEARERLEEAARQEREEAEAPAFEAELETCTTLSRLLGSLIGSAPTADDTMATSTKPSSVSLGTPNARPVDEGNIPVGKVLQKKGEREESYFMGKGTSGRKASGTPGKSSRGPVPFKLPLSVMEQLWDLKIDVPVSLTDVPKALEALGAKRQWYLDNQERVTNDRKAKAERRIEEIMSKASTGQQVSTSMA